MRYDLVILDNDGVLCDSEPISNRVLAEYLTELGHPTTFDDSVRDFLGTASHHIHDVVRERSGRALPDGFDDLYHARVFAAFEAELAAVAGAEGLLKALAAYEVPYCLASSAPHAWIRTALDRVGLRGHLPEDRIFSAEDVGRGKPAPDLFLHAARVMGADPAGCAVVEDSPNGVLAARAAGMDVYGYAALTPAARLGAAGATALFTEMAELPGLLGISR
ncbi:HAD family hydrolase [Peterkaempfera bronchialis]|uniref:HAD family phosphatase n=1 Tax=Peterkaempfera bronchialis TaxID=2126346 RepID=A0A345SYX8_9ACTN|nr:HAD family phosphatase [Peterkaempfera bronchialis]AXI78933.1 HAD family phosphatase [Peterkaempfera bronchialis]